jgi:hypothetical protein
VNAGHTQESNPVGVVFPPDDSGKRSSMACSQAVLVAALREASDEEAHRAERARDWRVGYIPHVVAQERLACRDPAAAIAMAAGGLEALRGLLHFRRADGSELSLGHAVAQPPERPLSAHDREGRGHAARGVSLPWGGQQLQGQALVDHVAAWVAKGIAEPEVLDAVNAVLEHPEWLDLGDLSFVLLGAGAEMSPAAFLARHGAHLIAVDLPDASGWDRLAPLVEQTPVRITMPGRDPEHPGADLLTDLPALAAWLADLPGPLVICHHAYADGARHLLLAGACEALVEHLGHLRDDLVVSVLGTPTDAYAIPARIADELRAGGALGGGWLARLAKAGSRGYLCAPNLAEIITSQDETRWAMYDGLVGLQGVNYAMAKRVQRWRCLVSADAGHPVSFKVAPAAMTRSVVDHRAFAAAYAGASLFGAEVFPPETAAALMGLLLVHDLRANGGGEPAPSAAQLYSRAAVHGGFWRSPFKPRTVIGLAALKGLPRTFRPGGPGA